MQIGILEMPASSTFKVTIDGTGVKGYLTQGSKDRWIVRLDGKDLRTMPRSKEAAACLLLFHHFTNEREALDARAGAERDEVNGGE